MEQRSSMAITVIDNSDEFWDTTSNILQYLYDGNDICQLQYAYHEDMVKAFKNFATDVKSVKKKYETRLAKVTNYNGIDPRHNHVNSLFQLNDQLVSCLDGICTDVTSNNAIYYKNMEDVKKNTVRVSKEMNMGFNILKTTHQELQKFKNQSFALHAQLVKSQDYFKKVNQDRTYSMAETQKAQTSYEQRLNEYEMCFGKYKVSVENFNHDKNTLYSVAISKFINQCMQLELRRFSDIQSGFTLFSEAMLSFSCNFTSFQESVRNLATPLELGDSWNEFLQAQRSSNATPSDIEIEDPHIMNAAVANGSRKPSLLTTAFNLLSVSDETPSVTIFKSKFGKMFKKGTQKTNLMTDNNPKKNHKPQTKRQIDDDDDDEFEGDIYEEINSISQPSSNESYVPGDPGTNNTSIIKYRALYDYEGNLDCQVMPMKTNDIFIILDENYDEHYMYGKNELSEDMGLIAKVYVERL